MGVSHTLWVTQHLGLDNANVLITLTMGVSHTLGPEKRRKKGAGVYINHLLTYYEIHLIVGYANHTGQEQGVLVTGILNK